MYRYFYSYYLVYLFQKNMHKFILATIFILGTLLHVFFLDLNQVLKVADSFAYLQMSHFLAEFDLR